MAEVLVFLALLAAVASVFAAPTGYLCYRWRWGLSVRLLGWAAGATLIGVVHVTGVSSEGVLGLGSKRAVAGRLRRFLVRLHRRTADYRGRVAVAVVSAVRDGRDSEQIDLSTRANATKR
jgi:hypothetical protein